MELIQKQFLINCPFCECELTLSKDDLILLINESKNFSDDVPFFCTECEHSWIESSFIHSLVAFLNKEINSENSNENFYKNGLGNSISYEKESNKNKFLNESSFLNENLLNESDLHENELGNKLIGKNFSGNSEDISDEEIIKKINELVQGTSENVQNKNEKIKNVLNYPITTENNFGLKKNKIKDTKNSNVYENKNNSNLKNIIKKASENILENSEYFEKKLRKEKKINLEEKTNLTVQKNKTLLEMHKNEKNEKIFGNFFPKILQNKKTILKNIEKNIAEIEVLQKNITQKNNDFENNYSKNNSNENFKELLKNFEIETFKMNKPNLDKKKKNIKFISSMLYSKNKKNNKEENEKENEKKINFEKIEKIIYPEYFNKNNQEIIKNISQSQEMKINNFLENSNNNFEIKSDTSLVLGKINDYEKITIHEKLKVTKIKINILSRIKNFFKGERRKLFENKIILPNEVVIPKIISEISNGDKEQNENKKIKIKTKLKKDKKNKVDDSQNFINSNISWSELNKLNEINDFEEEKLSKCSHEIIKKNKYKKLLIFGFLIFIIDIIGILVSIKFKGTIYSNWKKTFYETNEEEYIQKIKNLRHKIVSSENGENFIIINFTIVNQFDMSIKSSPIIIEICDCENQENFKINYFPKRTIIVPNEKIYEEIKKKLPQNFSNKIKISISSKNNSLLKIN